jgi:endogenous inhibitor of DNA gyrase (YacG/DUF329 family)
MTRWVKCPTCGNQSEYAPSNRWRPFCSERCRNVDLGAWATDSYRVPAKPDPADEHGSEPGDDAR